MKKALLLSLFGFSLINCTRLSAQLNVNSSVTATQLVNTILGGGVTISNVVYTGTAPGKGTFTSPNTNLGMISGITLSSGDAVQSGSALGTFASENTNGNGDPDLDIIVSPKVTYDAAVLEFDFSVASDSVQFRYVFGSEEYNDYVNTAFNDVFGFFISGPGIVGIKNIAVIPNTTTAVSINNVNNGGPYPGLSSGPCTNCNYFVDNINGPSIYLDAFTTVLTAKSAVQPCETYHIKLAIADVSDHVFNSAVFIEGGSFSSLGQINLFANGVAVANNDTVFGCVGSQVTLNLNSASNYNWSTGATTQSIVVNSPPLGVVNQYSAFVSNPNFSCFAFTTTVYVATLVPTAVITPNGSLSLCPGGNVALVANTGNNYLWSNGATTQSVLVNGAGTYTVTVTNLGGCSAVSVPVSVTIGNAVANITGPAALCNGAAANLQANVGQAYIWSTGATTQNISAAIAGVYTVTVTQAGGCTATASVNLNINPNPIPAITGVSTICQGGLASLNAGAGFSNYLWSNAATMQTIAPAASGTYTVTVTDANGCTGTTSVLMTINPNPTPTITGPTNICAGSSANLNAGAGFNGYVWSNGVTTQIQNFNLPGTYTVTVTDANGCSGTTTTVLNVVSNPTPSISGLSTVCSGAAANIDAGGGYLSYLWSNGNSTQVINPTTSGTYTVTVAISGGCTGTASVIVTVNNNPTPSITGINTICQGSGTSFNGGAGYSNYSWSNGSTTQTININSSGTYTVTVTDANGCSGTSSNTLTVNANPAPSITGTASVCQGASSILNGGGGYLSYNWNGGSTNQTISANATGNYTVTVTDNNGCTGTASFAFTVNALPNPTITGVCSICSGSAATLNGGGGYIVYAWSDGSTSQVINPTTSGIYTVTVTDANGCSNTASINVTVNANPVPVVTGINTICQGANTTFNGGAGYSQYNWSNGNSTQTINVGTSGTYTVTVTDINGCTGTASYSLTVNPNPSTVITGTMQFCQGLNSVIDGGAGFSSYVWNNGSTTQNITISNGGTYTVTVTNNFGCTNTATTQITVNALPVPSITGSASICQGANSLLDAGAGYTLYAWSNGNTTQQLNTVNSGTFTVTVTNANGCTGTASFTVVVNANPTPVIVGNTVICQGTPTTFNVGNGYATYVWNTGANSASINPTATGTYTVTVTDNNGCTATATLPLTVNPLPQPSISGVNSICQGNNTVFDAGAGFVQYAWSNGSSTQTINLNSSGTFTVTVTDNNGCTNSASYTLVVNALPTPTITGVPSICQGTSTVLDPGSYVSYQWNNGNANQTLNVNSTGTYTVTVTDINGCSGTASFSVVANALPVPVITGINSICDGATTTLSTGSFSSYVWSNNSANSTLTTGVAGNYVVTVTDANGCTGSSSPFTLTVLYATSTIAANGPLHFCAGGNVSLSANSGSSYLWTGGATTQTINVNSSGTYIVTVINTNGCTATSAPVVVGKHEYPIVKFLYDSAVICGALRVQFFNQSQADPGSTIKWQFGDGGTSTIPAPVHDYGKPGTYTIILTVTSPWGCSSTDSTSILVDYPADPIAKFTCKPNIATFLNPQIQFTDLSQHAVAWYWNFDDGEKSEEQNPLHFFKEAKEHVISLTVLNISGCQDTYKETILITPLWIPNTFTPNNDGKNDSFFTSDYIANVQSYRMVIYNRWGGKVYETTEFTQPWDGLDIGGNPSPEGTYVYRLEVVTKGGKAHEFSGTVDLLR
ncbi:MAG TPA: choice-of-anchor L domain-containing protein [Bacteroidia bacterium]|nr:choice-of-anchor L domain-containing protein [Bacteroidia bacterium]